MTYLWKTLVVCLALTGLSTAIEFEHLDEGKRDAPRCILDCYEKMNPDFYYFCNYNNRTGTCCTQPNDFITCYSSTERGI